MDVNGKTITLAYADDVSTLEETENGVIDTI